MSGSNFPWKYSHLKSRVGYRRWEAIKHVKERNKIGQLLSGFKSGKRILFIHIPKTAGVSLIKTYEEFFVDARHSPALQYKLLLGRKYNDFSTFSIVRNPWARLFSAYNFLKDGGLNDADSKIGKILVEQCPTFENFVKEWLPENGVCSYMHFVPQYEFVCGLGDGVIVENIVKLERLDSDWHSLAENLDIPQREIQHANTGTKNNFREYYDNESIDIVTKLYQRDIELLDYAYE